MKYFMKNFSNRDLSFIQGGDEFDKCNLRQNRIALGTTPITLPQIKATGCNIQNCFPAEGSEIVNCNDSQIDHCYWLNPNMGLAVEPENCRHVTAIETVSVDGVVQDDLTQYARADYVYPRWRDR